jgi:pyruvate/2-oxoglutarate dehydrogenase complex dihydrolipoamide acyltransferase (E2) component
MARTVVKLPKVADSVDEVLILQWLVDVGAQVWADDVLLRVETDKVDMEIPAPVAGTLSEILVDEGAEVSTGTPICVIDT